MKLSAWIQAFRLRTLPLALSSILMGNFLALNSGHFSLNICLLALLTTLLLQILSNLANDYGDFENGADNHLRVGPARTVQSGAISAAEMKKAILIFVLLCLISGILLLFVSFGSMADKGFIWLFLSGIAAIGAAFKYTAGKNPYGYVGLGDIAVFLFFGLLGVTGAFYLQVHSFDSLVLLPAVSCGCFATAVLNLNNMRDIETDQLAGKRTIPVRIGLPSARIYHFGLLLTGMSAALFYMAVKANGYLSWIFVLSFVPFAVSAKRISAVTVYADFDPFLKQTALSTLLFVVLFGISIRF